MATQGSALAQLEATTMEHYNAPVNPAHSLPAAERVVSRVRIIRKPVPLPVQRFMDRMSAPKGQRLRDKLARDLHSVPDYTSLPQDKQRGVDELHDALAWHNPATGHPYLKAGLTFAEGRHILVQTYKEIGSIRADYPQDVRHALNDFVTGLQKDLDDAAKRAGFYDQYSRTQADLRDSIMKGMRA